MCSDLTPAEVDALRAARIQEREKNWEKLFSVSFL